MNIKEKTLENELFSRIKSKLSRKVPIIKKANLIILKQKKYYIIPHKYPPLYTIKINFLI